jgi:hypothetical protein
MGEEVVSADRVAHVFGEASSQAETTRQLTWLTTRMKQAAPQALIVAP